MSIPFVLVPRLSRVRGEPSSGGGSPQPYRLRHVPNYFLIFIGCLSATYHPWSSVVPGQMLPAVSEDGACCEEQNPCGDRQSERTVSC